MDNRANNRKSIWMLVSSMLIFGTIGVFRRHIPLSSAFLAFSRGIMGGLFLLVFMKAKGKEAGEKLPGRTVLWLILTGAMIGINWMLLFEAYNHTTVAVAILCYYMQPTIVMQLSPLIFGERLTAKKTLCAAVAIAGMVLVSGVIGGGDAGAGAGTGNLRGVALGLGAAVLYAAVVIMNKRISGVDAYRKTTIQLLVAGIIMIPYLLLTSGVLSGGLSGGGIHEGGLGGGISGGLQAGLRGEGWNAMTVVLLLIVGIVHTGIAYVLYFGSMDGLKAQSVAILSYIDPVSALLFSALLLGEPLSVVGSIGAVMIIGSAIVSEV